MPKTMIVIFICGLALPLASHPASTKYRPGTIMAVKAHHAANSESASSRTYDISVKVDNTTYVVLYTQPAGTISPIYRTGLELPVLVGRNTIKFNDKLGRSQEMPILSRRTIPESRHQGAYPVYALPA